MGAYLLAVGAGELLALLRDWRFYSRQLSNVADLSMLGLCGSVIVLQVLCQRARARERGGGRGGGLQVQCQEGGQPLHR